MKKIIEENTNGKKYRILILDYDGHVGSFISEAAQDYKNLEPMVAITATEGMEIAKTKDLDAAIINYFSSETIIKDFIYEIKKMKNILPVIVITATEELKEKERLELLNSGTTFIMEKPFNADEIISILSNLLLMNESYKVLEHSENIIKALIRAVEARDKYTIGHSEAVAELSLKIFDYSGFKNTKKRKDLFIGCLLHDIGKIGIKDNILLSPNKLSDEDFDKVKKHPIIGYNICKDLHKIKDSMPIILEHHERLDGSGYPYNKKGIDINILSQICAVADMYHSMTSDRSYRTAMPIEKALYIIRKDADKGKINYLFKESLEQIIENDESIYGNEKLELDALEKQ